MNAIANPIFGRSRGFIFRFGGKAFFKAARTVRRCTLYFWAIPLMAIHDVSGVQAALGQASDAIRAALKQ
jgi:hypothetical protein